MTIPVGAILVASTLMAALAVLGAWLSRAPGWRELRWLAVVSATASVYAVCDLSSVVGAPDWAVAWASRVGLVGAGAHGVGWVLYMREQESRKLLAYERFAMVAVASIGLLALVPGLVVANEVHHHRVEWLGVTYADSVSTAFGNLAMVVLCLAMLVPFVHFARRWRQRRPGAAAHAVGLALLFLCGINDSLVTSGLATGPYLLDVGFLMVVAGPTALIFRRFIANARALDELSSRLERAVEERTRELARANEALSRAEKLAAVGQLAAGVAHEINNPAAVLKANLSYLREQLTESGDFPTDSGECLDECLGSVQRVTRIVRQLLDAGRNAGGRQAAVGAFSVSTLLETAVAHARQSVGARVRVSLELDDGLWARGQPELVEQVLVNLVANASHAIEEARDTGHVVVRARRARDRVEVTVSDDGPGITADSQKRLFEPFFTTKRVGKGTGLGLAVSLGLMRAQGGTLALRESSPAGTTMAMDLPAASGPDRAETPSSTPVPRTGLRLLLVDDDPTVLGALRRQLSSNFFVEDADGVGVALARVRRGPDDFDLVLCDVVMPDGGAERFHSELALLVPSLAARTLFITAGAPTGALRRFLDEHSDRVLAKPVDVEAVLAAGERLLRNAKRGAMRAPRLDS